MKPTFYFTSVSPSPTLPPSSLSSYRNALGGVDPVRWVLAWQGQRGTWCGCGVRARRRVVRKLGKAVHSMALGFD